MSSWRCADALRSPISFLAPFVKQWCVCTSICIHKVIHAVNGLTELTVRFSPFLQPTMTSVSENPETENVRLYAKVKILADSHLVDGPATLEGKSPSLCLRL